MLAVAGILFGFLLTVCACAAFGLPLTRRLPLCREERWPVAFLLGSAIFSGVLFVLALTHMVRRGVVLAIVGAAIWYAWKSRSYVPQGEALPKIPRRAWYLPACCGRATQ